MSVIDLAASPSDLRALAEQSNAWPFEQAKAIVARLKKSPKDEVLFETGYGPSGLPHIGTFGEVARTTMVRHAFRVLTEDKIRTRLLAFSDDMVAETYVRVEGAFPLIGVGGIHSGGAALTKIRAGASLIQLYSSLVYKGLGLVDEIKRDLASTLLRTGRDSLSEIVGADAATLTAEDWPGM